MSTIQPDLYIKNGCPWCREAMDTLDKAGVTYHKISVSDDPAAMKKMIQLSGQSKAPTMDWNGEILADFGAEELIPFLKSQGISA
ncbi:MAG: glutaredoxin family protein [Candidatus Methylacidiphilales bacterium]